ncbi:hypothetical protein FRB96_004779 [Tulasnella sp. 330]|nr:hypothetical protein FRB96_004779 [Tulasnella sp. 330]
MSPMSARSQMALSRRVAMQARSSVKSTPRSQVRFNSSTASSSSSQTVTSAGSSPFIAGIAGGCAVLMGGYAYYHLSGTKAMVESAKSVHQSLQSAKDLVSPNEAIKYLRNVAKSYVVLVPGAASYVDATFDGIDELHSKHKDEVDAIVNKAYDEIKKIVADGKMDLPTAGKVFAILQEQGRELGELAAKVGGDIIGPIIDKHPELMEKIGGSWDDLKQIAGDAKDSDVAQRAQSIYDDTTKQVGELFSKGFSPDAIQRAKELIDQKTKEVKELTGKAAQEVWNKGRKEYLDKAPEEVKSLFSDKDTMSSVLGGSGAMASAVAIWSKVKEVSTSQAGFDEKSVQGLKYLVQRKVKDAQGKGGDLKDKVGQVTFDAGWNSVKSWVKTVPGGEKAIESAEDLDVTHLSALVTSKKAEAQDLIKETYSDVVAVLKEKADKAKKLADQDSSSDSTKGDKKDEKTDKKDDKKDEKEEKKDKKDDKKEQKDNKKERDDKDSKKSK